MSESSSDSAKTVGSRRDEHVTRRAKPMRVSTERSDKTSYGKIKNLKVPQFSSDDPELWFALLEAQFETFDITDDHTKFSQVINNLDIQHARSVKDVITNPPTKHRYEKIKAEVIKRFADSHERRVKKLLTHEELGDRKPSEFLRHLQDLAGPAAPEDFIKSIWTNRLPSGIQALLASQPSHSLDQLADLADRIQELTQPCGPAVAAASSSSYAPQAPSNEIAEIKQMIGKLARKLDEHTRSSRCTSHGRSRPRQRSESPSRNSRSRSQSSYRRYPICWYHFKFGENARRCVRPCDYGKSGNATGNR
ncbi:uncharacterized protein LOC115441795 [Manduca sexta]|uniref:uncharacterized protein LOC115441795 n=1 Tax=Manduca sexta TaxID=7130 RepID=UPI00188FC1DD|nr:uncharacterized protein LOC115441795 [Manduca sexta]